ncbi:MAG: PQQ-binding-like beta-propeller repeat protein [Bryobacteraceae bacterium]
MKYLSVVLALSFTLSAADWPQWRGVHRDGKSAETGLLAQWPEGGPKLVWKASGLGEGYSSMSIAGGRVYTLGQRGDVEFTVALDAATGKKLWETAIGGPYRERRGHGPRGVPTVEGDRLWALAADGTLACLNTRTGAKLWTVSAVNDFGGSVPHWGYSESPLIDGERVIFNAGGSGTAIVALNKNTGKVIWKSQSDSAAYSSAIVATVGQTRQVLTFTSKGAISVRADNGELLWRYDNVANRTANIATPIFRDGQVFYSSAYGTGAAPLKLTSNGGGVKADEVYFTRDMMNHYSSSVLVGDALYGFSNAILTALKFQTGEVLWKDRSVGKGSVIFADGRLYALGEGGTVALIEASPTGYKEVSRFSFAKSEWPVWAPPAISDGKLFIRDQDTLYCHAIK